MKHSNKIEIKQLVASVMSCGDCSGFSREALLPNTNSSCAKQGALTSQTICPNFRANAFNMSDSMKEGTEVRDLLDLINKVPDESIKALAGLLLKESKTRALGSRLGMRVYVRYRGRDKADYASNFLAARVLDVSKERIRLISDDGATCLTFPNTGFDGPIYSEKSFGPIRKNIRRQKMAYDPEIEANEDRDRNRRKLDGVFSDDDNTRFKTPNDLSLDNLEIPDLASVSRKKKKSGKRTSTLLDLANIIEQGTMIGVSSDGAGVSRLRNNDYNSRLVSSKSGKSRRDRVQSLDDMEE